MRLSNTELAARVVTAGVYRSRSTYSTRVCTEPLDVVPGTTLGDFLSRRDGVLEREGDDTVVLSTHDHYTMASYTLQLAPATTPAPALATISDASNPFPAGSIEATVYAVGTEADQQRGLAAFWASPGYPEDMRRSEEARVEGERRTVAGEQPWQQPGWNVAVQEAA